MVILLRFGNIEIIIDPDLFCTSYQISSMNKKAWYIIPLKPKAPFKWVFMDIIPSTASKSLTSDTTFSNYILIVDAFFKIPKIYGMEKSQHKKLWISWICSNPDLGKYTNLDGGI